MVPLRSSTATTTNTASSASRRTTAHEQHAPRADTRNVSALTRNPARSTAGAGPAAPARCPARRRVASIALVLAEPGSPTGRAPARSVSQVSTPLPTGAPRRAPPGSGRRSPRRTRTRSAGCRRGSPRRARPPRRGGASACATTGSSTAPATRTTVGSSMPACSAATSARSSRTSVIVGVPPGRHDAEPQCRRSRAGPASSGRPSPLTSAASVGVARGRRRPGRSAPAGQVVAHPVPLGPQVAQVLRVRPRPAAAPGR